MPPNATMWTGRHFTVDAANALLPVVRAAFTDARPLQQRMISVAAEMRQRGFTPVSVGRGGRVPGEVSAWQQELEDLAVAIEGKLRPLAELGIEIKAADGLVDFRSMHHGRTVQLCWRWDEPEIGWFHEIEGGFAGRQRIADPSVFEGDLLN